MESRIDVLEHSAVIIQKYYRAFRIRKKNSEIDLNFASLVAEIEPDKLLEFWDTEALSRRNTTLNNYTTPSSTTTPNTTTTTTLKITTPIESKEIQTEPILHTPILSKTPTKTGSNPTTGSTISAKDILGTKSNQDEPIGKILSDAGFSPRSLTKKQLLEKRKKLLSDLWFCQNSILERQKFSEEVNGDG
jgi:hypothetical protein